MSVTEKTGLIAALEAGDSELVIGTHEREWLEFKQAPYHLKEDAQKLEFLKDVTSIANAGGGYLVIGFATKPETHTGRDIATELSRVRQDLVDAVQYRDVLESNTYPPLRNTSMRWWLVERGTGVLTIEIPAADENSAPIIVNKVKEDGIRKGLLMGIFVRSGERVNTLSPAEIHSQIQVGRALQRGGFQPSERREGPASGPSEEDRGERLDADTRDAGLAGHRRLFMQAWPMTKAIVSDLHLPGGLHTIIAGPPSLRDGGFNLRTGLQPALLPGGGLRVISDEKLSLSIQRNGLITWVVTAGPDFLAWASGRHGRPTYGINTMALVESVLEFVRFFAIQVVPRCEPQPGRWVVVAGMADLREEGDPTVLAPGSSRGWIPQHGTKPSPVDSFRTEETEGQDRSAEEVAFDILREIYAQFGIDESHIPYSEQGRVSEELIKTAK